MRRSNAIPMGDFLFTSRALETDIRAHPIDREFDANKEDNIGPIHTTWYLSSIRRLTECDTPCRWNLKTPYSREHDVRSERCRMKASDSEMGIRLSAYSESRP